MTQEEWRWEPDRQPEATTPAAEPSAPAETPPPAAPVPPVAPAPPPVPKPVPYPAYGYTYAPPPQPYTPPIAPPVIPDYAEETDTTRPLWQAVINPLLPAEWQQARAHKRQLSGWCLGLAVLLSGYLGVVALYYGPVFVLVHLVFLSVAWLGYYVRLLQHNAREQEALTAYSMLEAAGREVTVYCDRIEAVGLRDTVVVPFAGAVMRESQGVLTVENHGAMVAVRSADLTATEATALTVLLSARIADRRGKKGFFSYRPAVEQRRPAPLCRPEKPLFVTRFTHSVGQVTRRRIADCLKDYCFIWMPLVATIALMLTECWATEEYFLLCYGVTLLSVIVIGLLVQTVAVTWDAKKTAPADTVTELRFYRDRLVLTQGTERQSLPRDMVKLYLSKDALVVYTSTAKRELALRLADDAAALRAFLQG